VADPPGEADAWAVEVVRASHRRYAEAFDGKLPDAVAAAFTASGVLVTSSGTVVANRTGLHEFARSWIESHADTATRHTCGRHRVTVAPDRIESTCRATVEILAPDGTVSVLLRATYRDTLAPCTGGWRIARREVIAGTAH
jgi:hypothetical protein